MFKDRRQAGKKLSEKLSKFNPDLIGVKNKDAFVIGITRGGVVVAQEISKALKLPLDIIVIKKIGAPQNPELAIGAIGPSGVVFWDEGLIRRLNINEEYKNHLKEIKNFERGELENYLRKGRFGRLPSAKFRAGRKSRLTASKPLSVKNKKVILVDDGVATGATVLAAVKFFRKEKSKEVILAIPVIAKDTFLSIKKYFDAIVALRIEEKLYAIGQFYKEFHQVENEEVIKLLSN